MEGGKMPRTKRDVGLDTQSKRAKLKARPAPYWSWLAEGCSLGYRKNNRGGTWIARLYSADATPPIRQGKLGSADDDQPADALAILNYAQAVEKANEWFAAERAIINGTAPVPSAYTVADAMREYMVEYERRGKRAAGRTLAVINAHILPKLGTTLVEKLTRDHVRKWLDALVQSPARRRSKKGAPQAFKPAPQTEDEKRRRKDTANRILTVLKAGLNFALANERVGCSGAAWREVKPHKGVAASRTTFLTDKQQRNLVDACEGEFKLLVMGGLYTGARYGELRQVRVEHFHGASLYIPAAIAKTDKERRVTLHPEAQKFFADLCTGRAAGDPIFTRGEHAWGDHDQHRPMREACKAAGIVQPVNFYALRHTAASNWLRAGVPSMKYIADQLGNSVTICERHYAHLAFDHRAEVFMNLPALRLSTRNGKRRRPRLSAPKQARTASTSVQ
jgi:integrase